MSTYFLDHGLKYAHNVVEWADNASMLIDVWENGLARDLYKLRSVNPQYVDRVSHELGNEMVTLGSYQRRSIKGESIDYSTFVVRIYRVYLFIVGVEMFIKLHESEKSLI